MPLSRRLVLVLATIGALVVAASAAGAQTGLPAGATALSDVAPTTLEVVDVPEGLELRVRALPGTDQAILATLPNGALVRATGSRAEVAGTTWYELNLGGTIGWSSGFYLNTSDVQVDEPAVADLPGVTVLADDAAGMHEVTDVPEGMELRVRVDPGIGQAVITELPDGSLVRTTGRRAQVGTTVWLQVDLGGTLGWSSSAYLTPVEVEADAGADPDPVEPGDLPGVTVLADDDPSIYEVTDVPTGLELRLRAGPGTNQQIIDTIPEGTLVFSTGERAQAGGMTWLQVVYDGTTGWSSSVYLTEVTSAVPIEPDDPDEPVAPGVTVLPTVAPSTYRVTELPTGLLLNVRAGPGLGQPAFAQLPDGELVDATGRRALVGSTIWLEIDLGEATGWASSVYLTEEPGVLGISDFSDPAPDPVPEGRMTVVITDVDAEAGTVLVAVGSELLTLAPNARIQDADGSSMSMADFTSAREDVSASNPLIAEVTVTGGQIVALRQTAMI